LFVVKETAAKRRLGPVVEHYAPFLGAQSLGQAIALRVAERVQYIP
jgi:hypothetical protein